MKPEEIKAGVMCVPAANESNRKDGWTVSAKLLFELANETEEAGTAASAEACEVVILALAERGMLRVANATEPTQVSAAEVNAELLAVLRDLVALYDCDEGCRSLPQYKAAKAAIAKAAQATV